MKQAAQRKHGMLVVLSGPAGVGKTSLSQQLLATLPEITQSVSCTTRAPRPQEQDGREYHFVSRETFKAYIAQDAFLEWAVVHHEHLYGTLRQQVQEITATGTDALLVIDVQGAAKLRAAQVDAVYIFVFPPSMAALEARLAQRGSESEDGRLRRLAVAREELGHYTEYDYLVLNELLSTAVETLRAIILAERHRIARVGTAPLDALLQHSSPVGQAMPGV